MLIVKIYLALLLILWEEVIAASIFDNARTEFLKSPEFAVVSNSTLEYFLRQTLGTVSSDNYAWRRFDSPKEAYTAITDEPDIGVFHVVPLHY